MAFVVAIFITRFYDDVVKLGLQHKFTNGWVGAAVLFIAADFVFLFAASADAQIAFRLVFARYAPQFYALQSVDGATAEFFCLTLVVLPSCGVCL